MVLTEQGISMLSSVLHSKMATDQVMFLDGIRRHIRSIPFGGSLIIDQISEHYSIEFEEAEKIKTKYGYSIDNSTDEQVIVQNIKSSFSKSKTGMNSRIGYPHTEIANYQDQEFHNPIFSTGIGLIIIGSHI
jgi:cell division ATPase FtsA